MTDAAEAGHSGHVTDLAMTTQLSFYICSAFLLLLLAGGIGVSMGYLIGESVPSPPVAAQKSLPNASGMGLSRNGGRVSIDSQTKTNRKRGNRNDRDHG
jgi:hypothetical protein